MTFGLRPLVEKQRGMLKLSLRAANTNISSLFDVEGDVLAIGVFTLGDLSKKNGAPDILRTLEDRLGGGVLRSLMREDFKGKKDQTHRINTLGKIKASTVLLFGLGDRRASSVGDLRTFAARASRSAQADKAASLVIHLPLGVEKDLRIVAEGLELGAYRFTKHMTGDRLPKTTLASAVVAPSGKTRPSAKNDLDLGQAVAAGVNLSRDLSNEPPNIIYPQTLAEAAQRMGKAHGLTVKVYDYKEIVKKGMGLIDAVGRGSVREPRLIHISYVPKRPKKKYVFVGKGVTFDTGGICIKPAAGMQDMKHDMSGAANVVGLMQAVAALKPNVEVHGIIAAAENMPDGNAYRPADVWKSYEGRTVEIINTDAEGRLILADALAYARELEPDLLLDNATLTGACMIALGTHCSGFYASNGATANAFEAALKTSGEEMWHMPLLEDLREQLKSDVADIKHTGDRYGGSITAALFLREFIGDTKNWIHADIAGPANADRAIGWNPKGATGHGVLTFLSLIERAS